MSKSAFDFVEERMFESAKNGGTSAGSWSAAEDQARMKIAIRHTEYLLDAILELLKTLPYPVMEKLENSR